MQELAHVVAALAMQKVLSSTACDIIIDVFRTIRNKNSFNKTRSSRMNVRHSSSLVRHSSSFFISIKSLEVLLVLPELFGALWALESKKCLDGIGMGW